MDLQRFIEAQEKSYPIALEEIKKGRKTSHWIWYIFPQLKELGHSETAVFYGINGWKEAAAYMENALLKNRLIEISQSLLAVEGKNIKTILGFPDYLKVKSCMTLFALVAPEEAVFKDVIEKYYSGRMDEKTLQLTQENKNLFSGKAENYEAARPAYPNSAIEFILNLAPPRASYADIGAGTGKLTTLFARRGEQIIAVEPNQDMREQLLMNVENYPNVQVLETGAEATSIASDSIDIILVAQALHWFDLEKFRAECKRIGKKDCMIFVLYNQAQDEKNSHRKEATDHFFTNPRIETFANPVFFTKEKWLAYRTSHSHDPKIGDRNYQEHVEKVLKIFEQENVNGVLKYDFTTTIYWGKIN